MRFEGYERIQRREYVYLRGIMNEKEITQIEKWTKLKCGEIVFDSTKDNWEEYISTFHSKILNKNQLIFIVEDTEGNKFGGYIDAKIDKYYDSITDSKSFVFSLESNGRLDSMRKFNIIYPQYAFQF